MMPLNHLELIGLGVFLHIVVIERVVFDSRVVWAHEVELGNLYALA